MGPKDVAALLAVTSIGGAIRFARLSAPRLRVFDEHFYANEACLYVKPSDLCGLGAEQNLEHPPLGKWLISIGIELFGHNPLGWRFAAAVVGTASIALLFVLARLLLRSTAGATFASGLLAIDLMHFVHSRVGMLDVFLAAFVLAAFLFLALDRERMLASAPGASGHIGWRVAAGAAAGAAMAVKWSGAFVVVAVVVTTIAWEVSARRDRGRLRAFGDVLRRAGPGLVVAFALVPLAVYVVTFAARVHGDLLAWPWDPDSWLYALARRHRYGLRSHLGFISTNPFQSSPWSWPLLKRGFPYRLDVLGDGRIAEVLVTGSPLVWWSSIGALLYLVGRWIRRNGIEEPDGLILSGFAWNYMPWMAFASAPFLLGSTRASLYIFYMLPAVPFMCLALARVAVLAARRVGAKAAAVAVAFTVAAAALFAFYYPVLAAVPVTRAAVEARVWVFDDCRRPDHAPLVVQTEVVSAGRTMTERISRGRGFLAPVGWCWK